MPNPFVFKIEYTNFGTTATFNLGIYGNSSPINCTVDWGDGSALESVTTDAPSHIYDISIKKDFIISVDGYCPKLNFNHTFYLKDILYWGETGFEFLEDAFEICQGLTDISATDGGGSTFSNVTTFDFLFYNCDNLNTIDVSNWDMSSATTLRYMFYDCFRLNYLDVSNWNVSNVKNIEAFSTYCGQLEIVGLENWITSNIQDMSAAFGHHDSDTQVNIDLSSWDVSNLVDARSMFSQSRKVSFDVSNWDVRNLIFADTMFYASNSFNPAVHLWQIESLISAEQMLPGCGFICDGYGIALEAWSRQRLQKGVNFRNNGELVYNAKFHQFREVLTENNYWIIDREDGWLYGDMMYESDYCEDSYECLGELQNDPSYNPFPGSAPTTEMVASPYFADISKWTFDPGWEVTQESLEATVPGIFAVGELVSPIIERGLYQITIFTWYGSGEFKVYFPSPTADPVTVLAGDDLYHVYNIFVETPGSTVTIEAVGLPSLQGVNIGKIEFEQWNDIVLGGYIEYLWEYELYWDHDPLNSPPIDWHYSSNDKDSFDFEPGVQNLYNKNKLWEENTLYYFAVVNYGVRSLDNIWPFSVGGGIFFNYRSSDYSGYSFRNNVFSGVTNSRTRTSEMQGVFNVESTVAEFSMIQVTVRPYVPACDNLICDGFFFALDTFWDVSTGWDSFNKESYLIGTNASGLTKTREHNTVVFEAGTEFKYHFRIKDLTSGSLSIYVAGSSTAEIIVTESGEYEGVVTIASDTTYDFGFDATNFTGRITDIWLKKYPDCDSGDSCAFNAVYGTGGHCVLGTQCAALEPAPPAECDICTGIDANDNFLGPEELDDPNFETSAGRAAWVLDPAKWSWYYDYPNGWQLVGADGSDDDSTAILPITTYDLEVGDYEVEIKISKFVYASPYPRVLAEFADSYYSSFESFEITGTGIKKFLISKCKPTDPAYPNIIRLRCYGGVSIDYISIKRIIYAVESPEMLTDGCFTMDVNYAWYTRTGVEIIDGKAVFDATDGYKKIESRNRTLIEGTIYVLNIFVESISDDISLEAFGWISIKYITKPGIYTIIGIARDLRKTRSCLELTLYDGKAVIGWISIKQYSPECDELINNGDFTMGAYGGGDYWWPTGGWGIQDGYLVGNNIIDTVTTCNGISIYSQYASIPGLSPGDQVKYSFEVFDYLGGTIELVVGGTSAGIISSAGVKTGIVTLIDPSVASASMLFSGTNDGNPFTGKIRNVTARKYPEGDTGVPCSIQDLYGQICSELVDPNTDCVGNVHFSVNPSECLADFITSSFYGEGAFVNTDSVRLCADSNDELVDDGNEGLESRREFGYIIDSIADTQKHKEDLRKYASCFLTYEEGLVKMIPDRPTDEIAFVFDETNMVVDSLNLRQRTGRETNSVVRIGYTDIFDPDGVQYDKWKKGYAVESEPEADTGDIPWREKTIEMPGIQKESQAVREAEEVLNRSRLTKFEMSFIGFTDSFIVQLGDVVTITHPIGFTAYKIRVSSAIPITSGRYKISGYTYDAGVYVS